MTDTMLINKFKSLHKDRSKTKAGVKMLWLANVALLSWCAYNLVMIVYKIRVANAFLAYFPMAGR